MPIEQAARFGDVVLIAIPRKVLDASCRTLYDVVIDANNYYPDRDGQFAELDNGKLRQANCLNVTQGSTCR